MTTLEAIDWCEQFRDNIIMTGVKKEKYTLALKAMRTAITALDKRTPKRPIRANRIIAKKGGLYIVDDNEYWKCPECTQYDVPLLENQEHCHCCGQALDWSE